MSLRNLRKLDCAAKRCTADPGPPQAVTVPGLQRIIPLRFMLRCARDAPLELAPNEFDRRASSSLLMQVYGRNPSKIIWSA
jgi:hypothetical protein